MTKFNSSNHCSGPYSNPLCSANGLCLIPLLSDIAVGDCSNQKATKLYELTKLYVHHLIIKL